ncbi:MAG: DUF3127 domain-containing protein, partial [Flavobacteriaceae bacterium]|nr:DUF3127 domain-containing protein [Flavobacteriaceae bacterium]
YPEEIYGNFIQRTVWVKQVNERYPCIWEIQFWHDDGHMLNKFKGGELVSVDIEVRGKTWTPRGTNNEKVINILRGINIKKA